MFDVDMIHDMSMCVEWQRRNYQSILWVTKANQSINSINQWNAWTKYDLMATWVLKPGKSMHKICMSGWYCPGQQEQGRTSLRKRIWVMIANILIKENEQTWYGMLWYYMCITLIHYHSTDTADNLEHVLPVVACSQNNNNLLLLQATLVLFCSWLLCLRGIIMLKNSQRGWWRKDQWFCQILK